MVQRECEIRKIWRRFESSSNRTLQYSGCKMMQSTLTDQRTLKLAWPRLWHWLKNEPWIPSIIHTFDSKAPVTTHHWTGSQTPRSHRPQKRPLSHQNITLPSLSAKSKALGSHVNVYPSPRWGAQTNQESSTPTSHQTSCSELYRAHCSQEVWLNPVRTDWEHPVGPQKHRVRPWLMVLVQSGGVWCVNTVSVWHG